MPITQKETAHPEEVPFESLRANGCRLEGKFLKKLYNQLTFENFLPRQNFAIIRLYHPFFYKVTKDGCI